MEKKSSLLEIGPGTPAWALKNRMKRDVLQAERIAAARKLVREERVELRARPPEGKDGLVLTKGEESWLTDYVAHECSMLLHHAEADLAPAAKKLKMMENRLGEIFAFVLGAANFRRVDEAISTAKKKFAEIIKSRKKQAAATAQDNRPDAPVEPEHTTEVRKKKKRRGRKPNYDHAADARLLKQFRSTMPRLTEKEFAEAIGKGRSFRLVRRALQRARSRERLMADYQNSVKTR